jgi:hypothetical protein
VACGLRVGCFSFHFDSHTEGHVSDPNDNSIPVLHEVLVPGRAGDAHPAPAAQPAVDPGAPREPGFRTEPVFTPLPAHADGVAQRAEAVESAEPVLAPQPVLTPHDTRSPEPVIAPQHEEVSAGVFDRTEPLAPLETGDTVPPDISRETEAATLTRADLDADEIAERLRRRFAGFLTGEGRGVIEARCREALQEHTSVLVSQITREVALTLESELTGWVREAVEEEIARRAGRA